MDSCHCNITVSFAGVQQTKENTRTTFDNDFCRNNHDLFKNIVHLALWTERLDTPTLIQTLRLLCRYVRPSCRGMMFSTCPSLCACVCMPSGGISSRLAIDFCVVFCLNLRFLTSSSLLYHILYFVFIAMTLLLGCLEEHPTYKKWVMRCCCGYLSGARYRLFAYRPADAAVIPKPHHVLPRFNPNWFYLPHTGLLWLSWKTGR